MRRGITAADKQTEKKHKDRKHLEGNKQEQLELIRKNPERQEVKPSMTHMVRTFKTKQEMIKK